MAGTETQWRYRDGDEVVGPLDDDAIRQLHKAGVVGDATEVAPADSDDWQPLVEAGVLESGHSTSAGTSSPSPGGPTTTFPCPGCGAEIEAEASMVGLQVPWKQCDKEVTVPAQQAAVPPPEEQEEPKTVHLDPLPEGGTEPATPSWDLEFDRVLSGRSNTGFARRGQLRVEGQQLVIAGWKLWPKWLRVILGIILSLLLLRLLLWMSARLTQEVACSLLIFTPGRELIWEISPDWEPTFMGYIAVASWLVAGIGGAWAIAARYLALPGEKAFSAVTRPRGSGRSLKLKLRPEGGIPRQVRLRFHSREEAADFKSHFEPHTQRKR